MMRLVLLVPVLAGCVGDVGPCTPAPRWQIALPYMSQVAVVDDGSLVVWTTSVIERVGPDGQMIATQAIPASNGGPRIGVAATGATIIALCSSIANTGSLLVYDGALVLQKTIATPICVGGVAIGPAGQIAYTLGETTTTTMIHALDPSGVERWTVAGDGGLDYAPNGDVVVSTRASAGVERIELDAATGAVVLDATLAVVPTYFARDGSYAVRTFDHGDAVGVIRRDHTGADLWTRALHSLVDVPVPAPNGDIVVAIEIGTQVTRLAAATGEPIATTAHCTSPGQIVGATADGYFLREPGVFARFAGP